MRSVWFCGRSLNGENGVKFMFNFEVLDISNHNFIVPDFSSVSSASPLPPFNF